MRRFTALWVLLRFIGGICICICICSLPAVMAGHCDTCAADSSQSQDSASGIDCECDDTDEIDIHVAAKESYVHRDVGVDKVNGKASNVHSNDNHENSPSIVSEESEDSEESEEQTKDSNSHCHDINHNDSDKKGCPAADQYYIDGYAHYSIHEEMLKDKVRTGTYHRAIVGNPELFKDKIVLDVGCGTGILSLFAAKAGAKKVYGIEMASIALYAEKIVKENNYEHVIEIIHGRVEDIEIAFDFDPQFDDDTGIDNHNQKKRVDIIISEWMGYFLLFESMLDSVIFARDKWLKAGTGILMPDKVRLLLCAIEDQIAHQNSRQFWSNVYGFQMRSLQRRIVQDASVDTIDGRQIMNEKCAQILELDLYAPKLTPDTDTDTDNAESESESESVSESVPVSESVSESESESGGADSAAASSSSSSSSSYAYSSEFVLRIREQRVDDYHRSVLAQHGLDLWVESFGYAPHRQQINALLGYFDVSFSKCKQPTGFSTGPHRAATHWQQTIFYLDEAIVNVKNGGFLNGSIVFGPNASNSREWDVNLQINYYEPEPEPEPESAHAHRSELNKNNSSVSAMHDVLKHTQTAKRFIR